MQGVSRTNAGNALVGYEMRGEAVGGTALEELSKALECAKKTGATPDLLAKSSRHIGPQPKI